ncbi:MAG: GAF domain-containing protein [Candidatus Rokubacteria bacterium]|nr:GAF domain-containing protein [Candidatus Rokubacteria bacterium]
MLAPVSPMTWLLPPLMGVAAYLAAHHLWIWLARREPLHLWVAAWSTTSVVYIVSHYVQLVPGRPGQIVLGGRLAWTSAAILIVIFIGLSHALAGHPQPRRLMWAAGAVTAALLAVIWGTALLVTDRTYVRTDLLGFPQPTPVPGPLVPAFVPLILAAFGYVWHRLGLAGMEAGERRFNRVALVVYALLGLNDVLHEGRLIQSVRVFDFAFVAVGAGLTHVLVKRYARLSARLEEEVAAQTREAHVRRAEMTALAVDNTRLYEAARRRLRESEALQNVSHVLAETGDLTETVRRVAREAARALEADMVGVYLADDEGSVLRPVAGYHVPPDRLRDFLQFPFPVRGHRAVEEAQETGQPVWSSDAETDARIDRESWQRFPHRSSLFVPMGSREALLGGIFAVWWEERREATPEDLRLALAIGHHASAIIEKARLYEALARRLERMETLTRLSRILSSSLERNTVLREIARAAAQLMNVPAASFWLADEAAQSIELIGFSDPALEADWPIRVLRFHDGVLGWVATQRRPLHVPDAFADGRFGALEWWRAHGLRSFHGVPVLHEGALLAVLSLNGTEPFRLGPEDEALLGAFVAQAAVAIRNASLYEAEGQARHTAEAALADVKQLQGLLPICAYCKKIRNDSNYWQSIEAYLGERSQATFSHGICPDCRERIVKPALERWRRGEDEPA